MRDTNENCSLFVWSLVALIAVAKMEKKEKKKNLAVFRSGPTGINKPNERTGAQPDIFQGRGGFVKLGHFDTHFIKNSIKKGPAGKIWEFFLLDTLKTIFWMVNLT